MWCAVPKGPAAWVSRLRATAGRRVLSDLRNLASQRVHEEDFLPVAAWR